MQPTNVYVMKRGVPQPDDAIIAAPRNRMAGFAQSIAVQKNQIGAREMRALDNLEEVEAWPVWLEAKKAFIWLSTSRYEKDHEGGFILVDKQGI